jgi:Raf kinase inhibitor-like YbhB/YbcL family protein
MIRHRPSGQDRGKLPRTIGRVTGRRFRVRHGVTTGASRGAAARRIAVLRAASTLSALSALLSAIAGCGLVGGTNTGSFDVPQIITVTSLAFRDQSEIPARYTCFGKGISPPIHWSGIPTGTKALALVVDDSDAPVTPYIYRIVFDISPRTTELQEGSLTPNARQAQGSDNIARYHPPCPRSGSHSYRFTLYAMNAYVPLPNGVTAKAAWTAIAARAVARGRITGIVVNKAR